MKVNNVPSITQVISGRVETKINTIVGIQSPSLYQCILLPRMVIVGVGSITDQGPYLQCSENSIKANVRLHLGGLLPANH